MQNLLQAGALLAIGYLLGQDGKKQLVVCQCGADGSPLLPDISGQLAIPRGAVPGGLELLSDSLFLANNLQPRSANTTYPLPMMVDTRKLMNLVLVVVSTLDQAVTVQVVGHTSDSPDDMNGLMNIEAGQSLAAGSSAGTKLGLGLDLEVNWYPFVGLTIATSTAPTAGNIQVIAAFRYYGAK